MEEQLSYDKDRLRTLIRQKGLNLKTVGKWIGCNRDTMSRKLDSGRLTVWEFSILVGSIPLDREEFLSVWGMEDQKR